MESSHRVCAAEQGGAAKVVGGDGHGGGGGSSSGRDIHGCFSHASSNLRDWSWVFSRPSLIGHNSSCHTGEDFNGYHRECEGEAMETSSMILKENKGICFSVSLRTKPNTAALLRNYALETHPSNIHYTNTQTHSHSSLLKISKWSQIFHSPGG